jgi:hypothetical protein
MQASPHPERRSRALDALAVGRIVLGAGSLAVPRLTARAFGVRATPEVSYLTRIYGGRAIALGLAHLLAEPATRTRLQRISLGVDVSDTVTGLGHLVRRDAPLRGMTLLVALTGSYAAVGAARVVADLSARR